MIIYIDANGKVLEQEYTEIVQGDNDANSIYLIAPLAQNAVVTMSFECPNGYVTDTYLMAPSIDNMVGGLRMWKLSIKNIPITQYYGIVKYQIKATINGKTIAVARGKFKVQEGVDWQLPSTPDENVYADILNALNQVEAGFINKVDINYNNDDVEQEIINNENGLKLVKTEGETTAVYEFKADGLYQNGVKLVDEEELEEVKRDVEGLFSITDTLNADLLRLREETETHIARLYSTKVDIDAGNSKIVNSNTQISLTHANEVGEAITEATSAVLQNGVLKLQLDDRFYFNGKPEIVGERATIAIYSKEQNGEKDIITLSVADKELVVDEQKAVIKTNGVADEIMTASKTATKIVASVDNQTYVMSFELKNSKNETISTSQIDLPLESVVVNGTYADGILTLTLKNGNSVDINITDIIRGLATEEYVDNKIDSLQLGDKFESISSIDLSVGEPVLTYDTTDGISINTDAKIIYGADNKEAQFPVSIELPIMPADGSVTIDADDTGKKVLIKANLQPLYDTKLENNEVNFVISPENWNDLSIGEPYKYKATIDCPYNVNVTGNAVYELVNNSPVNFANYGFALYSVDFGDSFAIYPSPKFTFYAIEKPQSNVTLKVLITAPSVALTLN